eukprot:TRINITY_DN23886_c1_g1_i5.p1 TRINITY_DN23886_c1_g1~~TRINITY_DN23886_c1_g1_i5.p1  ORF type:complete len:191 (+),score=6.06 TRINITY_DN23886_c1_g1_i5:414-986(+)
MVFRKGGHLAKREKWFYGNAEVKVTNCYRYLGMCFTTKFSLNKCWSEMCTKGKKGVIEILRTMKRLNSVDMALFWKLFDTQIEPVLTYAAEIWGLLNNTFMEQIHTYAIKRIMKVPLHASNKMVYGETGRYPLYIRTYVKSIKYWLRLIKLPPTRISRQAYEMLLLQHETGRCNWVSCIKKVLAENGVGI